MKFCVDCGKKLPKPAPKHCPECGAPIAQAVQAKPIEAPKRAIAEKPLSSNPMVDFFLRHANWFAPLFFIVALFFFTMVFLAPYGRADQAANQFETYRNALQSDLRELSVLEQQFFYASPYLNLSERTKIASAYSRKAKDSIVTWDAFKTFADSNKDALNRIGANAPRFVSMINEGKAEIKSNSQAMAQELRDLSGTNKAKLWIASEAIANLEKVSNDV